MSQLERDLFNVRRDKFSNWVKDTYTLYECADLTSGNDAIATIIGETLAIILSLQQDERVVNLVLGKLHSRIRTLREERKTEATSP